MFLHVFKNTFKVFIRNKSLLFRSLIFPVVLAFLFNIAFSNLSSNSKLDPIPVIVDKELINDENFKNFLEKIEDGHLIKVKIGDESLLDSKEYNIYIKKKDQIITNKESTKVMMVESLLNSYLHNEKTFINILSKNPNADINSLFKRDDYIKDISNQNMNYTNIMFYSLLAMQCMYGYMWGLLAIYMYEANLSTIAKRNVIAPISKIVSISSGILVAWIINILVLILNLLVMRFIIGINFGAHLLEVALLILIGTLTGVSLGTLIGVSNKKDIGFKNNLGIVISMFLSFLSGLMIPNIKLMIERTLPILNKINPATLITDGIYSLYYYNSLSRFYMIIIYLSLITLIFILLTYFFIRGKKYDSL